MIVKQFGWGRGVGRFPEWVCDVVAIRKFSVGVGFDRTLWQRQIVWVLYGQASRAISMG